ncbi:uncharacterized protein VP01_2537g2 [Puccinia sorghi]|uniref:Uncharacterized protein n=1 Tax=Puccinia sorghi TaxID=27349 RepID=A0A0L6V5Z6_9BASI|nr:uncharacterized protein VP01_2537g2 [Puccinia sorghi]
MSLVNAVKELWLFVQRRATKGSEGGETSSPGRFSQHLFLLRGEGPLSLPVWGTNCRPQCSVGTDLEGEILFHRIAGEDEGHSLQCGEGDGGAQRAGAHKKNAAELAKGTLGGESQVALSLKELATILPMMAEELILVIWESAGLKADGNHIYFDVRLGDSGRGATWF